MSQKGQANFADQIDTAIDELFTAKRTIKIDPLTNEVRELSTTEDAAPDPVTEDKQPEDHPPAGSPPAPESVGKTAEARPGNSGQLNLLLNRLDQAFLSLDWEVSRAGVGDFQALLDDLRQLLDGGDEELFRVIDLTHSLMTAMAEKPAQVPPRSSGSLRKVIVLFKDFTSPDKAPEVKTRAAGLLKELQAINEEISSKTNDSGQENQTALDNDSFGPEIISADLPDGVVPQEISNIVNLHLSILAQCVNRLLPLEKLFGQNSRYAEHLTIHRQVRETLEEERDSLSTALNANYGPTPPGQIPEPLTTALRSNIETLKQCLNKLRPVAELARRKKATRLYRVELEIGRQLDSQQKLLAMGLRHGFRSERSNIPPSPALTTAVKGHIEALGKCIKQIIPLENLFGKTKGYDKLHAAQRRIRLYLETQKKQLTANLREAEMTMADKRPAPATASPWPVLFKARWQGITVLIPPDELAIETQDRAAKLPLDRPLPLKKLKIRPWSKLQPLFKGELAQMPETDLRRLQLPWLSPMISSPDQEKRRGSTLIILYKDKQGGSAIIDEPGAQITIDDNWRWQEAGADEHFMFKGFLCRQKERLPVLSVGGKHIEL